MMAKFRQAVAPLAICFAAFTAAPAIAEDTPPPIEDHAVMMLSAESWVTAAKPKVIVHVDAALQSEQSGSLRRDLKEKLGKVLPGAEWRFTNFSQSRGKAGLEHWRVTAEARVDDSKLGGLQSKVEKASRPGFKLTVGNINYQPTVAEREAAIAKLRAQIYKMARTEAKNLSDELDVSYRVSLVDFTGKAHLARPRPKASYARGADAMMAMESMPAAPTGIDVSEQIRLKAVITLTTTVK